MDKSTTGNKFNRQGLMRTKRKEVTLIFPPVPHVEETEKEALVSDLKSKAYDLWLSYIKKKFGPASDLNKVLPSGADPISLGLLSLSRYLKKRDIKVNYIHYDYLLHKKGLTRDGALKFVAEVTKTSNVCGLTSTTPTIGYAMQIAKKIKFRNPKIINIIGGPHVTYVDNEIINRYPHIDIVVRGEGEETLFEIINNEDQVFKSKIEIPGTTYRLGGIIKRAPDRPLLPTEEIPSPDYNILPKDFNPLLIDMSSRGCPFRCKFCAEHTMWKNKVRFRDPQAVAEELARINQDFKQDLIHIADSEIDVSSDHLNKLLDAIEQKNISCRFTVNLRPDAYKRIDLTLLNRMINLGFIGFFIGVESGSDYMLDRMGRNSIFSDFLNTIDFLNQKSAKIIIPYLMLGFPGETEDTLSETQDKFISLLEEERISFLFPKIFIPYPGTDPYENPEAHSIKISKKWSDYSRFGFPPPFSSPCLSNEALGTSIIQFYENICTVLQNKL